MRGGTKLGLTGLALLIFSGCIINNFFFSMPGKDDELNGVPETYQEILRTSGFVLAWDAPENTPEGAHLIYEVFLREHSSENWAPLGKAYGLTYEVSEFSGLEPGKYYDFAVRSVKDGEKSAFHTSLDQNTIPENGWILKYGESNTHDF
jgi:hypothetical protein